MASEANLPPLAAAADFRTIATPAMALAAAAAVATRHGVTPLILGDALEGESRELGTVMAGIARSVRAHGHPLPAPCVLLSGGETTVTIGPAGAGRGGPQHGIPAEPCLGPGRRAGHLGPGRRHRRHRRHGGRGRRHRRAGHPGQRRGG